MYLIIYFSTNKQILDFSKYAKRQETFQNFQMIHPRCVELKGLSIVHSTCLRTSLKMVLQIGPKHVAAIII